ncbi:MAG: hypothetical protein Q7R35_01435, partial [Elusimicrobiota bacterium]|nr:hypothetical protein [Elusimicrobiota bacterium]
MEDSTHYHITESAVNLLNTTTGYPDIRRFGDKIIKATSGPRDDANAHGKITDAEVGQIGRDDAANFNGGDFIKWWNYSDHKYKKRNFVGSGYNAYYYIGLMAHLVEDQAVPAHSANIFHLDPPDGLEKYAGAASLGPTAVSSKEFGKDPRVYYYMVGDTGKSIIKNTQDKLPFWTSPSNNNQQFWKETDFPEIYKYTGQGFWPETDLGWGHYGGDGGMDIYPLENDTTYTKGISQNQLNEAASYTAGMLMAVSQSLPPLISTFSITSATVNGPAGAQINFTLLENRLPAVKIDLFVVVPGTTQPIITHGLIQRLPYDQSDTGAEYHYDSPAAVTWTARDSSLYPTLSSDLSLLPQMASFQLEWSGEVAGEPLAPRTEPYTLILRVTDHDGNSTESMCTFTIMPDDFPPTVRWSEQSPDGAPIEHQVTGANTLETAPWFHLGYSTDTYISFWFDDAGTGVGNFSIYLATATPETPMFSASFRNGQSFLLSDFTLSDDATGYMLTAADTLGNTTTVYFHLDRHPPEINFSTIVVHKLPGVYSLDVYGEASDAVAGLAAPVKITEMGYGDAVPVAPQPWPPGPKLEHFGFTNLQPTAAPLIEGTTEFKFYTFDKSGLPNLSYIRMSNVRVPHGLDGPVAFSSGLIIPMILKETAFSVGGYASPLPGCHYLDIPSGMHVKAVVEARNPDPDEIANLNNVLSAFSDVHVEQDYLPVTLPFTLFDVYSPTAETRVYDVVLPRFVKFTVTSYGNSNPVKISCVNDLGEVTVSTIPPDNLKYSVGGSSILDALVLHPPLEQADVQFVPPGLNVKLVSGSLEVTFSEVTAGGQIFVNRATQYPEVPGYRIDKDNAYDLVINAAYRDIKVKACMNTANLSENQVANAELYHYSGVSNAWEKVTT